MKTTFRDLKRAYRERVESRRIYHATKNLDPHLLADIGISHDPLRDIAYKL